MSRSLEKFVVYNLRETYCELGRHEFKISLNPRLFKSSQDLDVVLLNPDGKPMPCEVKRWGRKLHCSFVIDDRIADGVALIKIVKSQPGPEEIIGRVTFWIIKH